MTITLERKHTPKGGNYWGETGIYWNEYSKLWDDHVPPSGKAETVVGEMIRCISRLQYDYYNNGNCNVQEYQTYYEYERCGNCDGDGEVVYKWDEDDNPISEECDECCGSGEIQEEYDGDPTINDYYQDMIDFLHEHIDDRSKVDNLEEFLTNGSNSYSNYSFSDNEESVYVELMDEVMFCVLKMISNNQNKPI
tara:strand:+ start:134 stop:715 length:582 start_codon:yes stop_codon:yes gene_type:complete